jgi:Mg2+-importing ATPase
MARATAQFQALGEEGFRVLGIAWREEPATQSHVAVLDEKEFVFAGYAAFLDSAQSQRGSCDRSVEAQRHRH